MLGGGVQSLPAWTEWGAWFAAEQPGFRGLCSCRPRAPREPRSRPGCTPGRGETDTAWVGSREPSSLLSGHLALSVPRLGRSQAACVSWIAQLGCSPWNGGGAVGA